MAVPAVVSSQTPPGETLKRFYELNSSLPRLRVPRLVGIGDSRIVVTTDAVTSGSIANLTTLGFVFPASSISVVRMRAYGRGAAATIYQYVEAIGTVMMNVATPLIGNGTPNATNVGGGTLATFLLAVSGNDVIVNFTGAATAYNWIMDINVEDPVGVVAGS